MSNLFSILGGNESPVFCNLYPNLLDVAKKVMLIVIVSNEKTTRAVFKLPRTSKLISSGRRRAIRR